MAVDREDNGLAAELSGQDEFRKRIEGALPSCSNLGRLADDTETNAELSEDEAMQMAVDEVRSVRRSRRR